jgi:Bacterial Ig-like domain
MGLFRRKHQRASCFFEKLDRRQMLAIVGSVGTNFEGVDSTTNGGSNPPDTQGAVSATHIVHHVNRKSRVFDKAGTLLSDLPLFDFYLQSGALTSTSNQDVFDPRVEFDPVSQRFYSIAAHHRLSSDSGIVVAVSNTSNPLDGWRGARFDADVDGDHWVDFPRFGFDEEGLYITADMIPLDGVQSVGHVFVIPKSSLLANTPTLSLAGMTAIENAFGTFYAGQEAVPVVDPNGLTERGLMLLPTNERVFSLAGTITNPVPNFVSRDIRSALWSGVGDVPQPAPGPNLSVLRTGGAIARAGSNGIFYTRSFAGPSTLSAIVVGQLSLSANLVDEEFLIVPDAGLSYPSVGLSPTGDLVVGSTMSGSGATQFPSSVAFVGRSTPFGMEFRTVPYLLKQGTGIRSSSRWGDYSATVVDPASPSRFWTFQQFMKTGDVWATQITAVNVVPAAPTALDLVAASDSGISNSDNVTRIARPTISGKAPVNSSIRVFSDGAEVGVVTADPAGDWSYTFTQDLQDGTRYVQTRSVVGTETSDLSAPLAIEIDTVAPSSFYSALFDASVLPQKVVYSVTSDVATMGVDIINRNDGTHPLFSHLFATTNGVVQFSPTSPLPNAFYRAIFTLADGAGNSVIAAPFEFLFMLGDFYFGVGDGTVDFLDLLILAQNYGTSGNTYYQGNLDYDPNGVIGFNDLLILAQNYGISLDPPIIP